MFNVPKLTYSYWWEEEGQLHPRVAAAAVVCVVVRVRVGAGVGVGGRQASGEQGWHPVGGWVGGWDKCVCVCVCDHSPQNPQS